MKYTRMKNIIYLISFAVATIITLTIFSAYNKAYAEEIIVEHSETTNASVSAASDYCMI